VKSERCSQNECYQYIGEIITDISLMEAIISDILCDLIDINSPMIGKMIISKLNFTNKIGLWGCLVKGRFYNQSKLIKNTMETIKHCEELRNKRNHYAHCLVQPFDENKLITYETKAKKKKKSDMWQYFKTETIGIGEMEELLKKIKKINIKLHNLRFEGRKLLKEKDYIITDHSDAL
jgi:hypothetical protein